MGILEEADKYSFKETESVRPVKPDQFILEDAQFLEAGTILGFGKYDFSDSTLSEYLTEIIDWAKKKATPQKSFLDIIRETDEELGVEVGIKRIEKLLTYIRLDKKSQEKELEKELAEKQKRQLTGEESEKEEIELYILGTKHFGLSGKETENQKEKIRDILKWAEEKRLKRGYKNKDFLEIIKEVDEELGESSENKLDKIWRYVKLSQEEENLKKQKALVSEEKERLLKGNEEITEKT